MSEPAPNDDALVALAAGGKRAIARALARVETAPRADDVVALLDTAFARPKGRVIGLTGTPGVGKSTLASRFVARWRASGLSVAVVAVDPSSRLTGGALLGDRTRIATDPDDAKVFLRSFAARDRLGGLSDSALAAIVLLAALHDRVLVESVGVGQSEADVALVADTVLLLIQPGSGDALQFMKAGVMELPDVVAVTKADMGPLARQAAADVAGALTLAIRDDARAPPPTLLVSARDDTGFDDLDAALDAMPVDPVRRAARARGWVLDAIGAEFGRRGRARVEARGGGAGRPHPHATLERRWHAQGRRAKS